MIDELDEVLEKLLKRELPIKNSEVEIAFDLPKREWSSRLNRPTLNLFLYDIRENPVLRQPEWEVSRDSNGGYSKRRTPARVDLHYMITAWAKEPEDEHRLLARALMALYRYPSLPEDLLPESFKNQPVPVPLRVAEHDKLRNPADIWSALDNEFRPAVSLALTLALDPYHAFRGPLVRARELRFGQKTGPRDYPRLDEEAGQDVFWMVGGSLRSKKPLKGAQLKLLERGQDVPLKDDGEFIVGNLEAGEYTLELSAEGRKPSQHKISVPSESYEIEIREQSAKRGGE